MTPAAPRLTLVGTPLAVASPERLRMLVVGDSIAAGATEVGFGSPSSGGGAEVIRVIRPTYVDLLQQQLPNWTIALDAVPHRRTADLVPIIDALLETHRPHLVLVATGSNDCDLDWRRFVLRKGADVRSRTPLPAFLAATAAVVDAVHRAGASVILSDVLGISLPLRRPTLEAVINQDLGDILEAAGGQPRADAIADQYRAALAEFCAARDLPLARYGQAVWNADHAHVIADDGTHPSAQGHRVIADAIAPVVIHAAARVEAALLAPRR